MTDFRPVRIDPDWDSARTELSAELGRMAGLAAQWESVAAEVHNLGPRLDALNNLESAAQRFGALSERADELLRDLERQQAAMAEFMERNPRFHSVTAAAFRAESESADARPGSVLGGTPAVEVKDSDDGGVAFLNDRRGEQTAHFGPYDHRTLLALGKGGLPGRIILRAKGYVTRADLQGETVEGGAILYLHDDAGVQTTHLGPYQGETLLAVGKDAAPGRIRLRAGGHDRAELRGRTMENGQERGAVLYLNDEAGVQTTHLGPCNGQTLLALGGNNHLPGCIVLRAGAHEPQITLDAASGDIALHNADCAEDFDVEDADVEAGAVMVLTEQGRLRRSSDPYDARVAGVVSGAGPLRPGIVLDRHASAGPRRPVALLGKTYCKVEAESTPIEVGTLLTTSALPGHAMAATDPERALGAVLGKAMSQLASGTGLIPILVALQ